MRPILFRPDAPILLALISFPLLAPPVVRVNADSSYRIRFDMGRGHGHLMDGVRYEDMRMPDMPKVNEL